MDGLFLVFEGPDGSGTTTHAKLLAARLEAHKMPVLLTREPTSGPIGQEIRRKLQSREELDQRDLQQLFTNDRAEHVANIIVPSLQEGIIVISDRYTLSTIVYGVAKGIDSTWLQSINANFPEPDLTIITLPPFEVCLERLGARAERDQFEENDFQRRVYDGYAGLQDPNVLFVNTDNPADETAETIWKCIVKLL